MLISSGNTYSLKHSERNQESKDDSSSRLEASNNTFTKRQFLKSFLFSGAAALFSNTALSDVSKIVDNEFAYILDALKINSLNYLLNHRRGGLLIETGPDMSKPVCNIAGEGFALASLPIAVANRIISKNEAAQCMHSVLSVIENNPQLRHHGWITHMIDVSDPEHPKPELYQERPQRKLSEFSSIDTTIFMFGALIAAEYFGDLLDIKQRVDRLYKDLDFKALEVSDREIKDRKYLSHGYSIIDGLTEPFKVKWDTKSEGILVSLLALADAQPQVEKNIWYNWSRKDGNLPIFTAYYPACFINDQGLCDRSGFSIWENARLAFQKEIEQCRLDKVPDGLYGRTACFTSIPDVCGNKKEVYHVPFSAEYEDIPNIIAPHAIVASLAFIPEKAQNALTYLDQQGWLQDIHGPVNSINLNCGLVNDRVTSIDVGSALLMLDAASDRIVYGLSDASERIQIALKNAAFSSSINNRTTMNTVK